MRPLEERIGELARPQARALRGALGLSDEREVDRFLVGVGTLTLLADAADEQPVLALLDERGVVRPRVLRRARLRGAPAAGRGRRAAVRGARRAGLRAAGRRELHVGRLGDGDARRLLGDGIEPSRRDDVLARAAGNPLALLELARPEANGRAAGAEQAYAERIAALPEPTQTPLMLAAAESSGSLATIGAAAAELGLEAAAFEPAELEGLVRVADGRLEFRHPLVRSAAYHAAPFARRGRAHLALAAALTGDEDADCRAWHRAAAVLGTDEQAADDLECTADRARRRSGHAAAAAALERAGELTADPASRARRLAGAAAAAWLAGDADRALELLGRIDGGDEVVRAVADNVHGLVAGQRGSSLESFDWFVQAAREGCCAMPILALQASIRAAMAALEAGRMDRLLELRDIAQLIHPATADERCAAALLEGVIAFAAADYDRAMPAFARALDAGSGSDDPMTLLIAG